MIGYGRGEIGHGHCCERERERERKKDGERGKESKACLVANIASFFNVMNGI